MTWIFITWTSSATPKPDKNYRLRRLQTIHSCCFYRHFDTKPVIHISLQETNKSMPFRKRVLRGTIYTVHTDGSMEEWCVGSYCDLWKWCQTHSTSIQLSWRRSLCAHRPAGVWCIYATTYGWNNPNSVNLCELCKFRLSHVLFKYWSNRKNTSHDLMAVFNTQNALCSHLHTGEQT